MNSHIAIIGAGISGLAAARALRQNDCRVTVFEQNEIAGGRISSVHHDGVFFDSGAQNIKSQNTALDEIRRELGNAILTIEAPICLHENGVILPAAAANAAPKWTCCGGMAQLIEHLAASVNIRFQARVQRLRQTARGIEIFGDNDVSLGEYSFVIVTIPAPQAVALLETSELREDFLHGLEGLRAVEYSCCLSVSLHFATDFEADWYALLARDRTNPLLWLARENAKDFASHGTALVAQLGQEISEQLWDAKDKEIAFRTCEWIRALLGKNFRVPLWSSVQRWKYAQPLSHVSFEEINSRDSRLIICGDATGAARVPDAYQSGLWAAQRITESTPEFGRTI